MTMTNQTAQSDVDTIRSGFEALARGDLAAFTDVFHTDATWNHRNEDRLGGIHAGSDGIVAFVTESMQLTAGTLRPMPTAFMADGEGRVAVLVHITASRPDGRTFDDQQVLVFTVDSGRVRTVDQFVGEPHAVTAFWA
jgi:ketosteroid isomerase-like protein